MHEIRERETSDAVRRPRQASTLGVMISLVLPVFVATACDSLLEVDNPGSVEEADLQNPGQTRTLVTGALGQFECALTQYNLSASALTGEFWDATRWAGVLSWMYRDEGAKNEQGHCPEPITIPYPYLGSFAALQQARVMSEEAYELISGFPETTETERNLAKLSGYGAYALTLLGEGYCRMTLDGGPPMAPAAVLALAEDRFTSAIDHAVRAGDDEIRQMALTGRARVRLNLKKFGLAAEDARQVSEGFVRYAGHSDAEYRRYNRVWELVNRQRVLTVSPAYRNLEVDGVPDPRVPSEDAGQLGQDGVTKHWIQKKFTSVNSPTPIASWKEAQLIIAEVEGGQTAVEIINKLRTQAGLPLFESNDPEKIFEQVIEERSREFFAEGHRYNDMLRLGIPLPSGATHKGVPYGAMSCMWLPRAEIDNNPNVDY